MSIDSVIPSIHFMLHCLLLLLPSVFPSIRVFSSELALHIRWPKYWSIRVGLGLTGLIFFLSKGTLKSLLQNHSLKASIIWHSDFFMFQLSHPYMTTEKAIALTRWTFVGKVMSLLFNILSRLVVAFLPRSNCLLISRLQSPSAVNLEPKKIKSATVSISIMKVKVFCLSVLADSFWPHGLSGSSVHIISIMIVHQKGPSAGFPGVTNEST